jgi:acetyl esterase/lipase
MTTTDTMYLWPDGAPGAMGDGSEDKPRLTPFLLDGDGPFAAVVVCPGGGYGGRAPHESAPIAQWLNTLGVAAFVLDYRVAPYRYPVPQHDAKRALRTVRANAAAWKIDPARVGILGFSAGGHLATSTATIFDAGDPAGDAIERQSSRPDALIACYPVISSGPCGHRGSFNNLLGDPPPADLLAYMSLEDRVTAETPPTFLWSTSDDGAVPVENSLRFAMALRANNVPYALHVFPSGPHGLGLAEGHPASAWTRCCAEWLAEIGFR